MINDKMHSDFFSSLDILEQIILIESFSKQTDYQLNLMAEYFDVSDKIMTELQKKVESYLNDIEEVYNDDGIIV